MFKTLNKGDRLFWARVIPEVGMYDFYELIVRTVEDTYFVAVDKENRGAAYPFGYNALGKSVFEDKKDAIDVIDEALKHKKQISEETYYEEY